MTIFKKIKRVEVIFCGKTSRDHPDLETEKVSNMCLFSISLSSSQTTIITSSLHLYTYTFTKLQSRLQCMNRVSFGRCLVRFQCCCISISACSYYGRIDMCRPVIEWDAGHMGPLSGAGWLHAGLFTLLIPATSFFCPPYWTAITLCLFWFPLF